MARYVIVITAADGTVTVCGVFNDEYRAVLAANEIEAEDRFASVYEIESPAVVLAEVGM